MVLVDEADDGGFGDLSGLEGPGRGWLWPVERECGIGVVADRPACCRPGRADEVVDDAGWGRGVESPCCGFGDCFEDIVAGVSTSVLCRDQVPGFILSVSFGLCLPVPVEEQPSWGVSKR